MSPWEQPEGSSPWSSESRQRIASSTPEERFETLPASCRSEPALCDNCAGPTGWLMNRLTGFMLLSSGSGHAGGRLVPLGGGVLVAEGHTRCRVPEAGHQLAGSTSHRNELGELL